MRSEKEIDKWFVANIFCTCGRQARTYTSGKQAGCYVCPVHGHLQDFIKKNWSEEEKKIIKRLVLEGEPRYSVEELEKLADKFMVETPAGEFVQFLESMDKEEIEEILERD